MGCLALNASFEPLTIIPARRAIRLVLDQKAEILEVDPGRAFRSPRTALPFPVVIRLVRFVHTASRRGLVVRDANHCSVSLNRFLIFTL